MSDYAEMVAKIDHERARFSDVMVMLAEHRTTAPEAATDGRYADAAANLRHLAATMNDMPADLLVRVADINVITDGLLSKVLSARLLAVGFEVAPFDDATALLQSLADIADKAAARIKRRRFH